MLVPNQLIEVEVVGRTLQYYRGLGYDVGVHDIIMVPPEHLPVSSHNKIIVVCDVCGKEFPKLYNNYMKQRSYNMDVCKSCSSIKRKMTNQIRYGAEWAIQNDEIKLRAKQTCMDKYGVEYNTLVPSARDKARITYIEKYGVEHPAQNETIKQKMQRTSMERYGCVNPMQNPEIQARSKQVIFEKYGVDNPFASPEIQAKIKEHYLKEYGVEYPSQVPEIHEKMMQSLMENGTGKASKPQRQLYEMVLLKDLNAQLNYPFYFYSLDIVANIQGVCINIEYDGWYWHQDRERDLRRDCFILDHGIKILRIRSGSLLPSQEELNEALVTLATTDSTFQEIILSDWEGYLLCQEQLLVAQ